MISASYSLSIGSLFTLSLAYAKTQSDLYLQWFYVFFPLYLVFLMDIVFIMKKLIFSDEGEGKDILDNPSKPKKKLLREISSLFFNFTTITILYLLADYLDFFDLFENKEKEYSAKGVYFASFLLIFEYSLFTVLMKALKRKENAKENNNTTYVSIFMNFIFSFLSSTTIICSSGACSSIYISTFTAFFSAFGISIIDWIPYLKFIAFFFITINLFSLYSAKKNIFYKPFIVSLIGGFFVAFGIIYSYSMILYFGNIIMIIGAIWNSRENKAGFGNKSTKAIV